MYNSSKQVKILGINVVKCANNYKIKMMKEIKDLNRSGKTYHIYGLKDSLLLICQFSSNYSIDLT